MRKKIFWVSQIFRLVFDGSFFRNHRIFSLLFDVFLVRKVTSLLCNMLFPNARHRINFARDSQKSSFLWSYVEGCLEPSFIIKCKPRGSSLEKDLFLEWLRLCVVIIMGFNLKKAEKWASLVGNISSLTQICSIYSRVIVRYELSCFCPLSRVGRQTFAVE